MHRAAETVLQRTSSSMIKTVLLLLFLWTRLGVASPCLQSGDETEINQALAKGGEGAVVSLCPGSVHRLNSTVHFTAPRQTLTTLGDPTGRDRALLLVEGPNQATAVKADCKQCSFATVKSLEIDGNRPQLLRIKMGGALVEMGNSEFQTVRDCRLYEPRGWSALHFREGDDKQCRRGTVINNEIGPCGEEWDDDYDGVLELEAPFGGPRADGISLACKDSTVKNNVVYDTTDGAIVLFGSSGSTVTSNRIFSRTRVILGGINLVDYPPWEGDYTGVTVSHNTLTAHGGFIKVGIVVGPASWSDDTDTTVHGGTVVDNTLEGGHFGYGIVVSSAKGFKVLKNTLKEDTAFKGVPGPRCPKAPENAKPMALLINRGSSEGTFQKDFVNGEVQHIICIDPPPVKGRAYKPWRLRDAPEAVVARQANDPKSQALANARISDALVRYQSTLLAHLQSLSERLDSATRSSTLIPVRDDGNDTTLADQEAAMLKRLETLERGEKRVRAQMEGVQEDWNTLAEGWKRSTETQQKPILEYIFRSVTSLDHESPVEESSRASLSGTLQSGVQGGWISSLSFVTIFAVLAFLARVGYVQWRRGGSASKGGKVI